MLFDEDTPLELISALRPDVLMKGSDYTMEQVVGGELVQVWRGQVGVLGANAWNFWSRGGAHAAAVPDNPRIIPTR